MHFPSDKKLNFFYWARVTYNQTIGIIIYIFSLDSISKEIIFVKA